MKGKIAFTRLEADEIIALIRLKVKASTDEQKKIRAKIRRRHFFGGDDFGLRDNYTEQDFLRVVKIVGETKVVASTEITSTEVIEQKDEAYIIDLCDEVLGLRARRQHRFPFLKGDGGTSLPVDAFYEKLRLVIEYHEKQHTEAVKLFDNKDTVSGLSRGEQRKLYDDLRLELLPKNKIKLVILDYSQFEHTTTKKLKRNREKDLSIIKSIINMELK